MMWIFLWPQIIFLSSIGTCTSRVLELGRDSRFGSDILTVIASGLSTN